MMLRHGTYVAKENPSILAAISRASPTNSESWQSDISSYAVTDAHNSSDEVSFDTLDFLKKAVKASGLATCVT